MLFVVNSMAEVGDRIEYIISFPSGARAEGPVDLYCLGKVLRAAPAAEAEGECGYAIAATLERYEFVRLKS